MAGGFPCQDISVCGKGAGIHGERSGLFFELARIAVLVGCRIIVLENVPAISTRGMGAVLGQLAQMGFDAEWRCISGGDVGSPQRRLRWFCVARANGLTIRQREQRPAPIGSGLSGAEAAQPQHDGSGGTVAHANGRGCSLIGQPEHSHKQGPRRDLTDRCDPGRWGNRPGPGLLRSEATPESRLGGDSPRVPDGLDGHRWPMRPGPEQYEWEPPRTLERGPNHTARLRCLGNAVIPQVAEVVGRWVVELEEQNRMA